MTKKYYDKEFQEFLNPPISKRFKDISAIEDEKDKYYCYSRILLDILRNDFKCHEKCTNAKMISVDAGLRGAESMCYNAHNCPCELWNKK